MPLGNSRNWFVGSFVILAFVAISTTSGAIEEGFSDEMLQKATPEAAPSTTQEEPKSLGVQDESQAKLEPSASPTPAAEEDCTSLSGMQLCSPPGRFWLRTDALMWWTSGVHLPALVTSNTKPNLPIIGVTGTQVLFGDDLYLNDGRGGVRMTLGGWLDRCHRWGIEADWLSLAGRTVDYSNTSFGDPIYTGRPFFNVVTGRQSAEIVAENNSPTTPTTTIAGTVSVRDSDTFDSAGFLVRYNLCCGGCGCNSCGETGCGGCGDVCNVVDSCNLNYCRTDFLFGYRHYALRDGLTIHESLNNTTVGFNNHFEIFDNFSTRNEFNGAELGLNTELRRGRWSVNLLTKLAFGMNQQTTDINGTTEISSLNGSVPTRFYPVGIYAGPESANGGIHKNDEFVVIPQLGIELGYQLTTRTRAFLGYNILYWGNVMRAGDQISQDIDPRNWGGDPDGANALPFPRFPDRSSSFWAQGINLGLEVRF